MFLPRVSKRRVSHHSRKFPIFFCMPSAYYTLSFPSYLLRKNIFHFPNDGPSSSSSFSPSPCLGHRKLPAHKSLSSSYFFWGAFLGCCCHATATRLRKKPRLPLPPMNITIWAPSPSSPTKTNGDALWSFFKKRGFSRMHF